MAVRGTLKAIGIGAGVATPAALWFSTYTPPLFPGIAFVTAGLSTVIAATIPKRNPDRTGSTVKTWILAAIAIGLLTTYILAFQLTTVAVPPDDDKRLQIGFGKAAFSLTDVGRSWTRDRPSISPEEMLMNEAAFSPGGVYKIWNKPSVAAAGALLIVLYLVGFATWTAAFAMLGGESRRSNG
jgi:hypothetical protein